MLNKLINKAKFLKSLHVLAHSYFAEHVPVRSGPPKLYSEHVICCYKVTLSVGMALLKWNLLTKCVKGSWQPVLTLVCLFLFRLTFFICSVGFTSPMLFDERKYPYHLMLQKFFCSGGHDALFE